MFLYVMSCYVQFRLDVPPLGSVQVLVIDTLLGGALFACGFNTMNTSFFLEVLFELPLPQPKVLKSTKGSIHTSYIKLPTMLTWYE